MIDVKLIPSLNLQGGVSVYFHIPFCSSKCFYCDFFSATTVPSLLQTKIIEQSLAEAKVTLQKLSITKIETLYIGGGSPSFAPFQAIKKIVELGKNFKAKEITIEANPEQLTAEWLQTLKQSGVSRFSVGIQSFNEKSLQAVGRTVTTEALERAMVLLKPYSAMLNLDLIAGLPYQTSHDLLTSLQRVITLKPAHISFYSLIVEEETPLVHLQHLLPSKEEQEQLWQQGKRFLNQAGYVDYETSNYCLVDKTDKYKNSCLHNRRYWDMLPYLGFGPGSVSNLPLNNGKALRYAGHKNFDSYLGVKAYSCEVISKEDFMFEHFMMALRTQQGLNKQLFISRFSLQAFNQYKEKLPQNLVKETKSHLALTLKGRLFLDGVLQNLL